MALILRANGQTENVDLQTGDPWEKIKKAVGYPVELKVVRVNTMGGGKKNMDMWINEEGKIRNLPYNSRASSFLEDDMDIICGDAVLAEYREFEKDC